MINLDYLNPRMLISSMGKILVNGDNYAHVVYLGKDEDVSNWNEIDESEVPKVEEDDSTDTNTDDSTDTKKDNAE